MRQQIERKGKFYVKLELLTAVVMTINVYWNITLCNPMKDNKWFRKNTSPPISGSKNKPNKEPA
jgi:hypothetical protein